MCDDIPLLLFAKAPIPGKVKTRLMPACSARQAADIAELLLEASIQRACKSWPGSVYLSAWLDLDHPFFLEMQQRYPIKMMGQCDGDLGDKMRDAMFRRGFPVAVMGCDAPHVSAATLNEAYHCLANGQSVIGPSEDGGYYLLGLTQPVDILFSDQSWGSDQVLSKTLSHAKQINLDLHKLPELNDIDEWTDLVGAAKWVPSLQHYLQTHDLYQC